MGKVHLLTSEVIAKIAAGEVIERPASVIKELMENAIDAKADSIEVHLKEAGKTFIHIKDNGVGIEPDDLEKIFLRHSTSKIQNIDDLFAIYSLGFRGEALYSIGAVADVTVKSKTQQEDSGWEIHWRGGEKKNLHPMTMNRGTDIEVKELFFNTPARKKFLKSNTTEVNQILGVFLPYTLLYPNIRFRLTHQGKDLIDLKPTRDLKDRLSHALNLEPQYLLETKQDFPKEKIGMQMVLGDMNIKRPRRDLQFIFVNERPVQNRNIGFHLNQIYRLIFPPEVYPFFAVYLQVPPEDVDVNVHPTKREVKIRNEQELCTLLRAMVEQSLLCHGKAKQVPLNQVQEFAGTSGASKTGFGEHSSSIFENVSDRTKSYIQEHFAFQNGQLKNALEPLFAQQGEDLKNKLAGSRYIGAFMKKFQLFEYGTTLLVVDQHAAQERIAYENFIKQMDAGQVEIQNLLSPILLKLSPQEKLAWEEAQESFESMGLTSNLWDKETLAIHAHPVLLKNPEIAARYLLAGETIAHCDHETLARRACRSSVMAGDTLGAEQAHHQRQELLKCKDPYTCPHGRPTVIEISENFLDKQFLRT